MVFKQLTLNVWRVQMKPEFSLNQGSSNLSLEGQSAAEFSSNPDQTSPIF